MGFTTDEDGSTIEDLLIRWEECREQGESLTAEELCEDRPELAEELARRIDALRRIGPVMASNGTTDPDSTTDEGPGVGGRLASGPRDSAECQALYRDLKFHAQGGLGEVFMATGTDLNREVALKFLKGERASDPDSRRRFFLEAEVTGRLEHPGVVPVYGLGIDPGGSPCYAMRFVRGETLHDAIAAFHKADQIPRDPSERALAFRGLLRRFVSVCNTIAYAHSRGVLHRDIKPRNVMLGKFDETLVVDWGLAKPFDRDGAHDVGEETLTPSSGQSGSTDPTAGIVGTPQFMSPEQAEGRWQDVSPPSDVYSLGATLYVLLTGRSPIVASRLMDVLEKVKKGDFAPPRQVKPEIPSAIEAICLRAMALKPADRYATALDLAADVDRWMGDEPVTAYREGIFARLARWSRRHRSLVRAAAAALIVGLFASAALAYQQSVAAERERAIAESEKKARTIAQTRLEQIEKANELLTSVFKDLDPRAEEKEGKSLRVILGDRLRLAAAHLEGEAIGDKETVGKIQDALGQSLVNLGFPVEAIDLFEKAARTTELAYGPDHPDHLTSRNNLAVAYLAAGRADEAAALHEENLKLREARLGADHPATIITRNNLAAAYQKLGKYADAVVMHERNLKFREAKLGSLHADTLICRNNLATSYSKVGRSADAVNLLEPTLKLLKAARGPEHPDTLSISDNLAIAYRARGRNAEAAALHESTLRAREVQLGFDHPDTLGSRNNLALTYSSLGRYAEALELHESTLRAREAKLGPDHPDTLDSRNSLAGAYSDRGRYSEAVALYESTLRAREAKLGPDHPDTLMSRNNLAVGYGNLRRFMEAAALHESTLKARELKLGADHPDTLMSGNNLAVAYFEMGRYSESAAIHKSTLEKRERILGPEHPDTLINRNNLATTYHRLRRYAEAIGLLEMNLKVRERRLGPEHPDTLISVNNLAEAYRISGRVAEAVALWEGKLPAIRRKFGVAHPITLTITDSLALALESLGHWVESESLLREVLARRRESNPSQDPALAGDLSYLGQLAGSIEVVAGRADPAGVPHDPEQVIADRLDPVPCGKSTWRGLDRPIPLR